MKQSIEEIAKKDGRYDPRALKFVFDALGTTVQRLRGRPQQAESDEEEDEAGEPVPHHISGAQLAQGVAAVAMDRWGRLAKMVLNNWGIKTTRDLGEIVYLMIRHEWMTAQETDRIEDFDGVFEFENLFERDYDFEIR
jgi:uncharacterized repeat protein (TIGR04138 family)